MCEKKGGRAPYDDDLANEVARSIRLFKSLIIIGSVSRVGVDIVRKAAEELLSTINHRDLALHQIHIKQDEIAKYKRQ